MHAQQVEQAHRMISVCIARSYKTMTLVIIIRNFVYTIALIFFGITHAEIYQTAWQFYDRNEYQAAISAFKDAADGGDQRAIFMLAVMSEKGQGVKKDFNEALVLYKLAATKGSTHAQHELGRIFSEGINVGKDIYESLRWFKMSALQGSRYAQIKIGDIYVKGDGITRSYEEAIKWYRLAALKDDKSAQTKLASSYLKSSDLPNDILNAYMWFTIAASEIDSEALATRELVSSKLTLQEMEQAQRMARECMASNFTKCD
jgi:TPR repeat protein